MTGVRAYYNEIDPYAAQWMRNLIAAGHIAPGEVDERSIIDVQPDDLRGYTQCHFFAGIGGWSLALRLAGVPDDAPVWTGSCPCQSFSNAGKRKGFADERHLWPVWFRLIRECCPATIFGEQVDGAVRHGWLDLVSADLEGEGYAFGAAVLGAHSVGAPHIRQRLYFGAQRLADRLCAGLEGRDQGEVGHERQAVERGCGSGGLADADREPGQQISRSAPCGENEDGRAGRIGRETHDDHRSASDGEDLRADPLDGFWRGADWLYCRDGKWRPVEPGTFPLAHGVPARMGRLRAGEDSPFRVITDPKTGKSIGQEPWRIGMLRGYGNAINPWVAAAFIESVAP